MKDRLPEKPRFQRLLHDSLIRTAHEHGEKSALITETGAVSYSKLFEQARRCASALVGRGLGRGDRVVIYCDNALECVVGIWAALWAGGVFVVVNPQTKAEKLRYIIDKSGAKILITDEHLRRQVLGMQNAECSTQNERGRETCDTSGASATGLSHVLCANAGDKQGWSEARFEIEDYWEVVGKSPPMDKPVFTIPLDVAALIFTSGSTGTPKGVTMTHQSMVFARDSITEYLRLSEKDKLLNVLPLAFDYGLYQVLIAAGLGATLVLERSFAYPGRVFERIRRHEVTVFPGVPTIFSTMLSMHRKTPLCFPSVRRVTNTAAALPPGYIPALRQMFPNALVFAMYGLTECKRVSYLEPELLESKRGSVGKAIPGTEMFLLSADGKRVGPGVPGILHVRGPHVMLGYWKDPERTAKMLRAGELPGERVLCAQDWFVMDGEGFFYFKGRSDDIIKSRGEKVSPTEVENVLYSLPGVREAAVIGVPDENRGQAIKAFVVLDKGVKMSEREVLRHCAARLENFMVPHQVEFRNELPKTDNGKIRKEGLKGKDEG
ncbi:MAG TPA: AMP-binding protein [Verrucomicrobiae bacterium]|nr:AMP-binding protein [Verrucomicrobiae bacterium]